MFGGLRKNFLERRTKIKQGKILQQIKLKDVTYYYWRLTAPRGFIRVFRVKNKFKKKRKKEVEVEVLCRF